MQSIQLLQFLPTIEMIAEELGFLQQRYFLYCPQSGQKYRGIRPYSKYTHLEPEYLYLLCDPSCSSFPVDQYAYISTYSLNGQANHICCPDMEADHLMAVLLELFSSYQNIQMQIDRLVFGNSDLTQMCFLAEKLFDNPVLIHDDWFIIVAMSEEMANVMPPEVIAASRREFIPRELVDDFKFNPAYLKTYSTHGAAVWDGISPDDAGHCLYVNLFDGGNYKGRFFILQVNRKFRKSDFLLAECIAQRVNMILNRKKPGDNWQYHSMDDIVYALLEGRPQDLAETSLLLNMMRWGKSDQYMVLRAQSQQPDTTSVLDHVIHGDLINAFPGSYVMLIRKQQCVVINLTKSKVSAAHVRYTIAPLCRDYFMYVGISSPVRGIRSLEAAFHQADIALREAFVMQNERWVIPFSTCALDVMLRNIQIGLQPIHLVSPELLYLMEFDQKRGTQYFETLKGYLLNERDIPRAAEALIVHRSTLIYRIKKIISMTNLNLEDQEQRLYLLISLKLLEQEEMKRREIMIYDEPEEELE